MKNSLLAAAGLVFKKEKGKILWLIVKKDESGEWVIPKTTGRKGESSVRAMVRYITDFGGVNAQVLEEVTRTGGTTSVNGRITVTKTLYYLIVDKGGMEIKLPDYEWGDLAKVTKKLKIKKEVKIFKEANDLLKKIEKEKGKDYWVVVE